MAIDFRECAFSLRLEPAGNGCQEFTGRRDGFGYGRFKYKSDGRWVQKPAHRHAMQIMLSRELLPHEVCRHSCDNPACCNVEHLSIGTQIENIADRDMRGRTATGERNGQSRLSNADAEEIRKSPQSIRHLARIYGVHHATISRVKRGIQHTPTPETPHDL